MQEIMLFRYMERLGISYQEAALETPWAEIERAFYIWSLDSESDKLKERKAS